MLFTIGLLLAIFVLPHPWGLLAVAIGAALDIAETGLLVRWSKRRRASVGLESMVGRRGTVVSDLWPEGQVKIGGELWRARCDGGCESGTDVVVRGVEGLTLVVEPAGSS